MEFTKQDTKIIKGAAICFMLFHHLFAFPERVTEGTFVSLWYFNETNLAVCLGAFGRICVPIFTFLSGYGIYRSSLKSGDCSALAVRHIRAFTKTYWMVFFVCLPVIVYKSFFSRRSLIAYDIIYNFLGLSFTFNNEWWFVLPFAVLLVLFPAMKRFCRAPPRRALRRPLYCAHPERGHCLHYSVRDDALCVRRSRPPCSGRGQGKCWSFFPRSSPALSSRAGTCCRL